MKRLQIFPIGVLILVLLLAGCQTSTVISSLESAVSAAEIAIPVIGAATGLNAKTSALIMAYLQQVNVATAEAATILANTSLTSAQKTAEIIKAFAGIAAGCNCVPPGTPQEVVAVVNAVAQAVLNFLTNFQPAPAPPVAVKVSAADATKLASLRARSEANITKLKVVRK